MARAAAALGALFLLIYLPDAGHGFVQDDFRWIVESRADGPAHLPRLFVANVGFYRPAVSLSFALDHALWGTNAFGYALTNLALCLGVALALFAFARTLHLPRAAALTAAGAWLLNFHGVNMAVLWLSGRTSLLVSLFALLSARAVLLGRPVVAGVLALLAMLSKEEAVTLPALFSAYFLWADRHATRLPLTTPAWSALAIYLLLRVQSGAFWPADAPSFYRFTFTPADVARNLVEYADRAGTLFAFVILVVAIATGVRWRDLRDGSERQVLAFASMWIAATYAVTVFLPVRSSLYALLPSLGTALIAGGVASAAERTSRRRFRMAVIGLIVTAVALVPVYRARNVRWVQPAKLSQRVLDTIQVDAASRRSGHIVLIDDPAERFNFATAFGGLFPEAVRFRIGPTWTGEIIESGAAPAHPADLAYRLERGLPVPVQEQ